MVKPGFHHEKIKGKNEWLTPPHIIFALGKFDLDPCAPIIRPWNTAEKHYNFIDDGLKLPWEGRVWLNPPYGEYTTLWIQKLAHHNNGIALTFARLDRDFFTRYVFPFASGLLFLRDRITFYTVEGFPGKGTAGALSVLIAYGESNFLALRHSNIPGILYHKPEFIGF